MSYKKYFDKMMETWNRGNAFDFTFVLVGFMSKAAEEDLLSDMAAYTR